MSEEVRLPIWRPGGKVVYRKYINNNFDQCGNMVYDGLLTEDEFWPTVYKLELKKSHQNQKKLFEKYMTVRDNNEKLLTLARDMLNTINSAIEQLK